jgi:hypothetical protein
MCGHGDHYVFPFFRHPSSSSAPSCETRGAIAGRRPGVLAAALDSKPWLAGKFHICIMYYHVVYIYIDIYIYTISIEYIYSNLFSLFLPLELSKAYNFYHPTCRIIFEGMSMRSC